MSPRVPDLLVEQLAHGELSAERAEEVRQRLAREPDGLARLAAIHVSDAEILAALPPPSVERTVRARLAASRVPATSNWTRRLLLASPVVAVAAALLVALVPGPDTDRTRPALDVPGYERPKGDGGPEIRVYRQTPDGVEELLDRAPVQAGDVLQLAYLARGKPYGVLASIDGRKQVTLHLPSEPSGSTALDPNGEVLLDHAYELDDAPSFEAFVFITSETPLDVDAVVAALETRGPGVPFQDEGGHQLPTTRFMVRKGVE